VTEAFGVLSVRESRVNYDLQRKKNPDNFREISEAEFAREHRPDLRNAQGNIPTKVAPGSYAEERLAELKKERDRYNVNHLGYYKGGLPQRDRGSIRGTALGPIGEFH
jgi:hypothetical protein